jgi:hypothetical protein
MTGKQTRDRQTAKQNLHVLSERAMQVLLRVERGQWSELIEEPADAIFAAASARSAVTILEQSLEMFGFATTLNDLTWVKRVSDFRETHECDEDTAIAVILALGEKLAGQAKDLIEHSEQCLNGQRTISGESALASA